MGRVIRWAIAFVLVLAACTDESDQRADATTTTADQVTSQPVEPSASDAGRLVTLDDSGDIVVMDADGSDREMITDDAGEGAFYTQPIWSPDSSALAWGQATGSGFAVGILELGADAATERVPTGNLPFYVFWSPNGDNLGVLHNGSSGVAFQMIDVAAGSNINLDEDTPFYFSWSPAGDRVVTHAGETRSELITPDGDRTRLEPTAGTYLAPQWTEAGVLHIAANLLVLEDDDGVRSPVARVSGLTMFVANQQGTRVALQTIGDDSAITASAVEMPTAISNAVVVVDAAGGEAEIVDNSLALGFFWSPDGESLLALTPHENSVEPIVWSADGDQREFAPYRPPAAMLENTFPFFPQYAQSVSFWAPDSSAFAYAGAAGGDSGIWVQSLDGSPPSKVAEGVWVAWSPGPDR